MTAPTVPSPAAPAAAGPRPAPAPLVIGLDLSLTSTGVAGAGWADCIRPRTGLTGHPRLAYLLEQIGSFIRSADLVVAEGASYRHAAMAGHEQLAGLRVMVSHWCWRRDIPLAVMPPANLKLYATGRGNAAKGEVRSAVHDRYGVELEGRGRHRRALYGADWPEGVVCQ